MNTVMFSTTRHENEGKWLSRVIESAGSRQRLEILRNNNELSRRLRRMPRNIDVAVLFAHSKDQLTELVGLADLLKDIRIILILPNKEKETIAMGHLLRPRFLAYADDDVGIVATVLERMLLVDPFTGLRPEEDRNS